MSRKEDNNRLWRYSKRGLLNILKVPCITLRENTEEVETVEDGWNVLVGAGKEKIVKMIKDFKPSLKTHKERFGSGDARRKIIFRIDEL